MKMKKLYALYIFFIPQKILNMISTMWYASCINFIVKMWTFQKKFLNITA